MMIIFSLFTLLVSIIKVILLYLIGELFINNDKVKDYLGIVSVGQTDAGINQKSRLIYATLKLIGYTIQLLAIAFAFTELANTLVIIESFP